MKTTAHGRAGAARGWSLSRRLTTIFVASTCLSLIVGSAIGLFFLDRAFQQDLDGLLAEEALETQSALLGGVPTTDHFAAIASELAEHHRAHRIAWRVRDADGRPWGDFGDVDLLASSLSGVGPRERTSGPFSRLRWKEDAIGDLRVGVLIDGSQQRLLFGRYLLYVALLVAGSVLAAIVVGRFFSRRVSLLLARIVPSARELRQVDEPAAEGFDLADAPEEIRAVVGELGVLLASIRSEHERARVFTAGLAHELRSPIQNLIGETEVALIANREPGEYRAILRSNLEELQALADAVDNFLSISSRTPERDVAASELFDLGIEADLRLRRERANAMRQAIAVEVRRSGDLSIRGDREAVMRAIRNLTANAIQWSPPGATVSIALEGRDDAIEVTVDDAGTGVSPELAERIFEPFYRGPAAQGRRIGFGLGLALSRAAALEQGGDLAVSDSPLGGARFRLVLPRTPAVGPA